MSRHRLPDRRPALSVKLIVEGGTVHATAGFDPATGAVREVFLRRGGPTGSDMNRLLDDVGVLLSHLLQLGVDPVDLAAGVGRLGGYPRVEGKATDSITVAQVEALKDALIANNPPAYQPTAVMAAPASIVGVVADWLAGLAVEIADDAVMEPWEADPPASAIKVAPDVVRIRAEQAAARDLEDFKPGGTD